MSVIRAALAGLAAVLLCAGAPTQAGSKKHYLFDAYCEFGLGDPVPAAAVKISTQKVAVDGGTRVFQHYKACKGRSDALIELKGGVVDTITVTRPGACIRKLACIGEPYAKVLKRHPRLDSFTSETEGRTVSLAVTAQATVSFNVQAAATKCFSGPRCGSNLKPQVVTRIYLHR